MNEVKTKTKRDGYPWARKKYAHTHTYIHIKEIRTHTIYNQIAQKLSRIELRMNLGQDKIDNLTNKGSNKQ